MPGSEDQRVTKAQSIFKKLQNSKQNLAYWHSLFKM